MKVPMCKEEIWPDYDPDPIYMKPDVVVEMTQEELDSYKSVRETYFKWLNEIKYRIGME